MFFIQVCGVLYICSILTVLARNAFRIYKDIKLSVEKDRVKAEWEQEIIENGIKIKGTMDNEKIIGFKSH